MLSKYDLNLLFFTYFGLNMPLFILNIPYQSILANTEEDIRTVPKTIALKAAVFIFSFSFSFPFLNHLFILVEYHKDSLQHLFLKISLYLLN